MNRGITTSRSSSVLWKELRDRGAGNEQLCDLGSEAAWSPRPHRHPSSGIRSKEQTSRCPPAHDWSQLDAKVRRIKSEPGVMHDVHKPDRVTGTPMIGRLAISAFARQARQQVDVPHCLDRLFRARTVPIIPFWLPIGAPPLAPCIRQTRQPRTAGARQRFPVVSIWLCTEARRGRFARG